MNKDFKIALNKDEIKQDAFAVIAEIEAVINKQHETVENAWTSLQKKYRHFGDFDLNAKLQRRKTLHSECETISVQIKENISSLLFQILEKLDSRIIQDDKLRLKEIKAECEEFQKEIKRYLNGNVELGIEI